MFLQNALISTEPTQKGVISIDIYNKRFLVKRIQNKQIKDINSELWIQIIEAEKLKLINLRIHMPWKYNGPKDEIMNTLKQRYLTVDINTTDDPEKVKIS